MKTKILSILAFSLFLASCVSKNNIKKDQITVSILPQRDWVKKIAGDDFKINVMVEPGAAPATYSPTPSQIKNLAHSFTYLQIGHIGYEQTWMPKIKEMYPEMRVKDLSKDCRLIQGEGHYHGDHYHAGGTDPHLWLSPATVRSMIPKILDEILIHKPEKKDEYWTNTKKFLAEIDSIDAQLKRQMSLVKHKKFMIFHPALTYYARDYGLEQISIELEGKKPSTKHIKRLIDQAKEEDIRAVFIQHQFDTENAIQIAQEIGAEVIEFDPLKEDWLANMKEISTLLHNSLQ